MVPLPPQGTDPIVNWASQRRAVLRTELVVLDAMLYAYGSTAITLPSMTPLSQPLIDHYPMLDTTLCGCDLCSDWAARRREMHAVAQFVPEDHRYHICDCQSCHFVKRVWMNLKAAENRRDLLIGASFHAYHNSKHGAAVMDWFVCEIQLPERNCNWWAMEGGRYPLSRWLRKCELQLSPIVSGAVFEGVEL